MRTLFILFSCIFCVNGFTEDQNQFVFKTEPPVDCLEDYQEDLDNMDGYDYKDYCVHKASAGNIITIDIRVKEGENQTVFDIPYSSIRHEGVLIQVYYNPGPFGKSQWFLLPYTKGIALFPGSITLPINQWVSEGLTIGGWVRAVILTSQEDELKVSEEPYSIPEDDPLFIDFSNIPEKRGDGSVYVGDDMDFHIKDYPDDILFDSKTGEPFDGKIVQDGDKDQGDLYLIYGHPYSQKELNYFEGKLYSVTHYDEGDNQVLCETIKEGEVVFQWSCLGC